MRKSARHLRAHEALSSFNRPISRSGDAFAYNERGEVVFSHRAAGNAEDSYCYDGIGNLMHSSLNGATNAYVANSLNQYAAILCVSASPCETIPHYDSDGSMTQFGAWTYAYDSANRLSTVSSNGVVLVANSYDAKGRRVRKATSDAATTFFYDGWNLLEERIVRTDGTASTIHYYWGRDLSGSLHGAGGVGGLLYLTVDGAIYVPTYDANGNVTRYLDANGGTVAQYAYDAFGRTISQIGPLAGFFRHRFSTKYYDSETGLYYYGYRFYHPSLMRWLNRDPIEEDGGLNLYAFCGNKMPYSVDTNGCAYVAYRRLDNPLGRLMGVVWSQEKERRNRVWAHQHIFFEDGKSPQDIGFFNDGIHEDGANNANATWIKTRSGLKDACLRKAVSMVPPLQYSLLGDRSKDVEQYNCQDWVEEVLAAYDALVSGRTYYPKSTKFLESR